MSVTLGVHSAVQPEPRLAEVSCFVDLLGISIRRNRVRTEVFRFFSLCCPQYVSIIHAELQVRNDTLLNPPCIVKKAF
jgi:hypothetical protein